MELIDAIHKANQILDEERSSPTVQYSLRLADGGADDSVGRLVNSLAVLTERDQLQAIRLQRPRHVEESPNTWQFKSVNYDLLCALHSRLPEDSRPAFLCSVLSCLSHGPGCVRARTAIEPSWNHLVSEFPLVAEFCIRNGAKQDFFRALEELELLSGHAILLRHLEDMIALNFTVLADGDYKLFDAAITAIGYAARRRYQAERGSGRTGGEKTQFYTEIIRAADGIREECRKARYFYLKGSLLEGFNLEVNRDKVAVESYLKAQGFSNTLTESLNRADQVYHSASSGFEFKSSMSHLRSFMEELHSEGLAKLQIIVAGPGNQKWGRDLNRLHQEGVLSKAEEEYAAALYTLLSDEGVHPIIAEKEYARLARNVVVEYALLFLRRLEKLKPKLFKAGA